ncbi:thioesterase family protein [Hyphomonas beringensis]
MGSCNQWDCDEMGHMNVRVYLEKQMEGLAAFAVNLNMAHAFRKDSPSTIIPVDQHIRFIREVLPGRPLSMKGCLLETGETDALVYQELRHSDGALAAAMRTRVAHVDATAREPFAWSSRTREAFSEYMDTAPEESAPRSVDLSHPGLPVEEITLERVKSCGAPMIGRGAVPTQHLDVHGRMYPYWMIGRTSDSVPNLLFNWRKRVAESAGDRRMGAAVLEYRIRYHAMPMAGDLYEIYSSFGGASGKTHALIHWMMNPATGTPWATMQATAITLDLDARKAIPAPPEMVEELTDIAPPGLAV